MLFHAFDLGKDDYLLGAGSQFIVLCVLDAFADGDFKFLAM